MADNGSGADGPAAGEDRRRAHGMTRAVEEAEYFPEYGTLVVRDGPGTPPGGTDGGLLGEYDTDVLGYGTLVRAGTGWLQARTGDSYQSVRLEALDAAPPDEAAGWDDVAETPYLSRTGTAGLTTMTGGEVRPVLDLGGPGRYRVRVCRRPAEDGHAWLLRWWPEAGPGLPPRRLARSGPLSTPWDGGWQHVLPGAAIGMRSVVQWVETEVGGPATPAELGAWLTGHPHVGRLDGPLWTDPVPELPTGHADLDAAAEQRRLAAIGRDEQDAARLAGFAAQLGLPVPADRRAVLDLLAAVGVLAVTDGPRYATVAVPPRAQDRLTLPAGQVRQLEQWEAAHRYGGLTGDLVSIAQWRPGPVTVADLAGWLLVPPADVAAALRHAAMLAVVGDPAASFELRVRPKQPPAPAPSPEPQRWPPPAGPPWGDAGTERPRPAPDPAVERQRRLLAAQPGARMTEAQRVAAQHASLLAARRATPAAPAAAPEQPPAATPDAEQKPVVAPGAEATGAPDADQPEVRLVAAWISVHSMPTAPEFQPPVGAPPRAGLITAGGDVVRWRDGVETVVAQLRHRPFRAFETAYGVLAVDSGGATLVRPDGTTAAQPDLGLHPRRSPDGRYVAGVRSTYGRRVTHAPFLLDLADGSHRPIPWDPELDVSIGAVDADAVYLSYLDGQRPAGQRWRPDTDPEPLPYRVRDRDPLTGTLLAADGGAGVLLVRPGGAVERVPVAWAELAPGGTAVYTYRGAPPGISLYDPATAPADPRVWWLPATSVLSGPVGPVWEDRDHLLVPLRWPSGALTAASVRLHIGTGAFEQLHHGYDALLIQPLLTDR